MLDQEEFENPPVFDLRQKCLPTYVVIDVSGSMNPYRDLLNQVLRKVHTGLSRRVTEFAHMSIIAFSTQAWTVVEMTNLEYLSDMPEVTCAGVTNYEKAFDLVRHRIGVDVETLRAQNKNVLRPGVFFLSDGAPNDGDWRAGHARLVDPNWEWRPHVITYGFGAASEAVTGSVSTLAAFIADAGVGQDQALVRAIESLMNSLVASAREGRMEPPTEVLGFRSVQPQGYID